MEQLKRYIDRIKIVTLFDGLIRIQGDVGLISYEWYKENKRLNSGNVVEDMIHCLCGVDKIIFDKNPNDVYVWAEDVGMYVLTYGSSPNPEYEKFKSN